MFLFYFENPQTVDDSLKPYELRIFIILNWGINAILDLNGRSFPSQGHKSTLFQKQEGGIMLLPSMNLGPLEDIGLLFL